FNAPLQYLHCPVPTGIDAKYPLCGLRIVRRRNHCWPGIRGCRTGDRIMTPTTRLVEVRTKILKQNDVVARQLREQFLRAGVSVISLVSSPGSGKTAFLEATLQLMRKCYQAAALVGDLATDNDARRLARANVPIKQIITGTVCHLEAEMVRAALADW